MNRSQITNLIITTVAIIVYIVTIHLAWPF